MRREGLRAVEARGDGGPGGARGASPQGAERSAPASPGRPGGGVHGPGSQAGRPGRGRGPESPRWLLSPARAPSPRRRAIGCRAEAPREKGNCKAHLQPD
ncbi:anaphase-promoting complex subunit 10 isoform X3 [Pteropus medius]|uniref:anaphase-promoting complex subunit 10 isoform X3 n=1 Tax=Pteropus vampyrus TaxID=132908 RepID=UPI00196B19E0|nr:anaphase-promoting complex subunit 10 isoform X3 [Pteropus giganteus]